MPLPEPVPTLSALDLLVSVAHTGSLRRAAALHRISQPAASQRLDALERTLGLQLLDRGPNGSRLTVAGTAVVEWAADVLQATGTLLIGAQALRSDASRELRVAASMTVAENLVPTWLVQLQALRPEAHVSLVVGNSEQVAASVLRDDVDLGFVEAPHAPVGLNHRVVGGDELAVVVAPHHPWARRRRGVTLADLAAVPLLGREPGSGTREALDTALAGFPGRPAPALELASTSAILAAAAAGAGPAVLSRLAVDREVRDGRLVVVPLRDSSVERRFRAVWRPGREPGGLAAALIAIATGPGDGEVRPADARPSP